eukprot:TRINITY_DN3621_c0_g2_i2.p1 TRINITY_DN3621_c0_g2~~TRINITY_DN3621_c0_g2_i2.p1  ORF type:complete len:532 (+),score=178.95 TRINITY_DN3621_c0_g2_i2:352-1947(+)
MAPPAHPYPSHPLSSIALDPVQQYMVSRSDMHTAMLDQMLRYQQQQQLQLERQQAQIEKLLAYQQAQSEQLLNCTQELTQARKLIAKQHGQLEQVQDMADVARLLVQHIVAHTRCEPVRDRVRVGRCALYHIIVDTESEVLSFLITRSVRLPFHIQVDYFSADDEEAGAEKKYLAPHEERASAQKAHELQLSINFRDLGGGRYCAEIPATHRGLYRLSFSCFRLPLPNSPLSLHIHAGLGHRLNFSHASQLSSDCNAITVAGSRLFVSDFGQHCVHVMDAETGTYLTRWGSPGHVALVGAQPHFCRPFGLAVDRNSERLYVADYYNHRIVVLHLTHGNVVAVWGGEQGPELDQYNYPAGLALDVEGGLLYVADSHNHRIKVVAVREQGRCERVYGGPASGSGVTQFSYPTGVALDHARLYVCDYSNNRVVVYRQVEGTYMGVLGEGVGDGPGQLQFPFSLSVDRENGWLYIADQYNRRIQVWNTDDGGFVKEWQVKDLKGVARGPQAVCWDAETESVYVTAYECKDGMLVY